MLCLNADFVNDKKRRDGIFSMMNADTSQAVNYHYGAFPPRSFDVSRVLEALLQATDALARYDQMLKNMHNSDVLLAPLRGQEALSSSRMEGTFSTMEELLELESEEDAELFSSEEHRSDTIETYLYGRSLRMARQCIEDGQPLSKSLIKQMHQLLLSAARGQHKDPGQFKSEQNYIGSRGSSVISFIPVSPQQLESGMDSLLDFVEHAQMPALLRVAMAHLEFEALHPFKDGNGRLGRMLITLWLWQLGCISQPHFYISRFFEDHKSAYVAHMREVSANNAWEDWCVFFLSAIKEQAIQNLQVAQSILKLYEDMKVQFVRLLKSAKAVSALDYVFTHPVFRNSNFTSQPAIPAATAARFSRILLEQGLIVPLREASGRKSAIYGFEPLLRLVRI